MTERTVAQLKADFQSVDPQDFLNNLVDSIAVEGETDSYNLGTLANTAGSGFAQSSSAPIAFAVYTDDNGATLGNEVYFAGRFRTLLTVDATGISLFGLRGQIKAADGVDFGPGVYAGVQGYQEFIGDTTVQSGAKFWGVDSSIDVPTSKTLTVASGGIAGGLHAELTGSGTATQSSGGILAGLYIDEQIGTGTWGYGVYMPNSAVATGIAIGTCTTGLTIGTCTTGMTVTGATGYAIDIQTSGQFRMGIQGTGIPTATATPFAMEIHSETASALTAGSTGRSCGIRSRYEISVAQPNQISLSAVEGRLRVKANIADGEHSGISGSIESDGAITYTGTATTQWNAGSFCIELGASCVFTGASGFLTGVTIDSSINATQTDIANITYPALRIKKASGALAWQYGLYIDDSAVATGIRVGTCSGTGISLPAGSTYGQAIAIGAFGTPIVYSSDELIEIQGQVGAADETSPMVRIRNCGFASGAMTTGEVHGLQVQAYGTSTHNSAVLEAIQGHVGIKGASTVLANLSANVPNMRAAWFKLEDLGFDLTLTGEAAVLMLGMQWNSGTTLTGNCDWIKLMKEGTLAGAGGVPDAFVRVYDGAGGGWANFLLDVPASLPYDATNSGGAQSGRIVIKVGGATKYIQCYSN